jgi:hypothetical protein
MKTTLCLIALALAAPALAAPDVIHTGAGLVIRTPYAELKTVAGRAQFLASVEESARRLCRDVHPRSARTACADQVMAGVGRQSLPTARQALQLAAAERDGVALAAR